MDRQLERRQSSWARESAGDPDLLFQCAPKREARRAIRAEVVLWGVLSVSAQHCALRAPRFGRF
jgi:hypothetical protein